jgi:hypothetical protein
MYNGQSSGQSAGRSSGQAQVVHVKVEDINIPFMHLVGLLLKVAIAAIPAAFIMFLFGLLVSALSPWAPWAPPWRPCGPPLPPAWAASPAWGLNEHRLTGEQDGSALHSSSHLVLQSCQFRSLTFRSQSVPGALPCLPVARARFRVLA